MPEPPEVLLPGDSAPVSLSGFANSLHSGVCAHTYSCMKARLRYNHNQTSFKYTVWAPMTRTFARMICWSRTQLE